MAHDLAYRHRDTIIYRLDPRVRLAWWLALTMILTTWDDPIFLFLLLVSVFIYGKIAGIPLKESISTLLPIIPFMFFVLIANFLIWRPPEHIIAHQIGYLVPPHTPIIPAVPVYWETIVYSVGSILRMIVFLSSALMLLKTVGPSDMALTITRLKIPPEIGMAVSMTFAYIPVMINQLRSVMEAQQSRAWTAKTSNPIARFRAYASISIPTFFRSFHAAEAMATAMMSRGFGYDIDHRTELVSTKFSTLDWILLTFFAACMMIGFLLGLFGVTRFMFTMRVLGF